MVWECIEKRRRIRRQESDGDGVAGEKNERKTKAEVVNIASVAEWLRAWDTLTTFEAMVCGR